MYIDLLIQVKNAQDARKETVKIPFSNINMILAELLAKNSYIESAEKKGRMPKRIIEIKLKYENGKGVIRGLKILSKPSRRIYAGYKDLKPKIRQGYGLGVVSTPKGILTTGEARKMKVGGELMFEIW